jgi:hypothetical protein
MVRDSLDDKQAKTIAGLQGKVFNTPCRSVIVHKDSIYIPKYQRDFYLSSAISHLVAVGGFDWNLYQVGSFHKNGDQYDAGDCMHRLVKALLIDDTITEFPGHIITGTYEEAAVFFNRVNGALTKDLTKPEKLHSRIEGKIPADLALYRFIQKCELACGNVNAENSNRQVSYPTLEKVYEWPKAQQIVPFISLLMKRAFGDRFSNQAFAGLCQLATMDNKYGSYVTMFESDNKNRQMFEKWLLDAQKANWNKPDDMFSKDIKLKTNNWDVSIAYDIMQQFLKKYRGCKYQLKPIQDWYKKLVNDKENA